MQKFLILFFLILCGCGSSASVSHRADTLILAIDSSPTNLDPRIGIDKASEDFHHLMFNGLLKKGEHSRMVPDLADSWDRVNPVLYRFRLRGGVHFHNGKVLDAGDVVYTYESILNGVVSTTKKAALQSISRVKAAGTSEVEIHLKEPFNGLPVNLNIGIVPKGSGADFAEHPVGTGPYRLVRFQPDAGAKLEAFPDYFEGPAKTRYLELRVIPDATTRALELRKGSIDLVMGVNIVPPDYLRVLKEDPRLKMLMTTGNNYAYLGFNLRDPVLKNRRVRQAIGFALQREKMIRSLFYGAAKLATGLLAPHHWAYEQNVFQVRYDPEHAMRLLDEAGYPDPDGDGPLNRLSLTYKTSMSEFRRVVATAIQSDLQKVGIDLKIRTYEWGTLFSDINHGNFQICMLMWVGESDPDIYRDIFATAGPRNRGKYSDPLVDEWVEKAKIAATEAEQKYYYSQVQKRVAEDCPYISLWYESNLALMRAGLSGLQLSPDLSTRVLKDVKWSAGSN